MKKRTSAAVGREEPIVLLGLWAKGWQNAAMAPPRSERSPFPYLARSLVAVFVPALLMASMSLAPAAAQDDAEAARPNPAAEAPQLPEGFDKKMAQKVTEVIEAVHPVRGLPAADGVAYRVIDNDTFLAELRDLFEQEYPDDYIVAEDAAFTRLGLLGPDDDLKKLILKVYDQQVLAYYDPATETFTLIGPVNKIGPLESIVVAHEYGHALQDAAWDLEGMSIEDLSQSDAILAQQALIEGDATAVMYDWAARELKLSDLLAVSAQALTQQDSKRLGRLPDIILRQIEFPYLDGYAFVNAVRGRGDWDAVDAAFDDQPLSTEQILHPELYPGERPVEIDLPDVAAALGPEWVASYEQTLGEMQTHVWVADGKKARSLFPALPAQLPNAEAAAGWGGDRLASLDGPDGAWAVVWQTDWDTKNDQNEFRAAAKEAMKDLPGAHRVSNADVSGGLSSPVLVLVADSEATLGALDVALGL